MRCRAKADTCMPKSTSDFMARATLLFSLLVASGAVASGAVAADPSKVLKMLQDLPPLPVPHYSWPFCHLENSCTAVT